MNRHFRDARYYLRRTVQTALAGVRMELDRSRARLASLRGEDPEPTRREHLERAMERVRAQARRVRRLVA